MEILTKFRHVPYNFYLTSWYATFLFKAFITFNLTIIDFVVASWLLAKFQTMCWSACTKIFLFTCASNITLAWFAWPDSLIAILCASKLIIMFAN